MVEFYIVLDVNNFYCFMIGRCVKKTDRTIILEFNLGEKRGDVQHV